MDDGWGDRDPAVAALFRAHYQHLIALAGRILMDFTGAEDVVMDAFLGLHRRWEAISKSGSPYGYLQASVVNGCHSRRRRIKVAAARLFTQVERPSPPADQAALIHLEHDAVAQALVRLSTRQRQVLVLRYYEGLSEAEIAAILGCGVGSVKTHASRGLKALATDAGVT
jgi:RNA polymerase sigma-70 factor (sigma-E family)